MKPAKIFQQYVWIVNKLLQRHRLSLEELCDLWIKDKVIDGSPLTRSSFFRHKDAILNMFGIIIECDTEHGYKYFIGNPGVIGDGSIERWMLSTLTVSTVLSDSASLRSRILLESVPAGEEYLQVIIHAIKTSRRLRMGYRKFSSDEGYVKTVCPYGLKLFRQRWYLLALRSPLGDDSRRLPGKEGENDEDQMRIYSLDRMTMVELTDEPFEMPADFSPQAYFSEYFGVLTTGTPMAHVVVRAHKWMPNYLRTLPLHYTQRELTSTPDYTDFSLDIRPTSDFLGELLRYSDGLEVLEPQDLREKMRQMIVETLKRY